MENIYEKSTCTQSMYEAKIQDLVSIYNEISKYYKWEDTLKRYLISFIYIQNNKEFDKEETRDFIRYIKSKVMFFSPYNKSKLLTASLFLNNFDKPKDEFNKLLKNHDLLTDAGFKSSKNLVRTNIALSLTSEEDKIHENIKRSYEIYKYMKRSHPFLTGEDDYPVCALISTSCQDVVRQIDVIEKYYHALNNLGFKKTNSLQLLSHILSLTDNDISKNSNRLRDIGNILRENNISVNNSYYTSLAIMTLKYDEDMVYNIIDVYYSLKNTKEFRFMGSENNLLMAIILVIGDYIEDKKLLNTILILCIEEINKIQLENVLFNGHDI